MLAANLAQKMQRLRWRRAGVGRWWPPPKKKLKNFAIIFRFFRIFILPSVNLCRVLFRHSAKALPSARQKALGKEAFAVKGYADDSLPSTALDKGFALGKARVCCSVCRGDLAAAPTKA